MSTHSHIHPLIKKRLHSNIVLEARVSEGIERLLIRKKDLLQVVYFLQNDPDSCMNLLLDVSCIVHEPNRYSLIWNTNAEETRYEVVYVFCSTQFEYRVQLSILLSESEASLATLTSLYDNAESLERETWDMFGVEFEGHPHIRRILMYVGFAGHPLKKSYPIEQSQPLIATLKR